MIENRNEMNLDAVVNSNVIFKIENFKLSFADFKEARFLGRSKAKRAFLNVLMYFVIIELWSLIYIDFSYPMVIFVAVAFLLLTLADEIVDAITYARASKSKGSVFTFFDDRIVVEQANSKTEMKYELISNVICTKTGVNIKVNRKINVFIPMEAISRVTDPEYFKTFLENKIGKAAKKNKYNRKSKKISLVVSSVVAVLFAFLPLALFQVSVPIEYDEISITLNGSYIKTEEEGSILVTSAYDGLFLTSFNYTADEFAYDFECDTTNSAEEVISIYTEYFVDEYDGTYVSKPQKINDGSYICEYKYVLDEEIYDSVLNVIQKNNKFYFVSFDSYDTDLKDIQRQKIAEYLKTVEINDSVENADGII